MPSTDDVDIHANQLAEYQCMVAENILQRMRMKLQATIKLLPQDSLATEVMQSPAARFQGSLAERTLESETSQYTGIFYDVKMSGEASHCPALRIPPAFQDL